MPLPLEPPPTFHLIQSFQIITKYWVELPATYSKFPLVIYFIYGNGYVSMLLIQLVPPSPSLTVSTCLFSMSASLLLPNKQVHQCHFSKFHIYALMISAFLFLTYFTLCNRLIHLTRTNSNSFLKKNFFSIYFYQLEANYFTILYLFFFHTLT